MLSGSSTTRGSKSPKACHTHLYIEGSRPLVRGHLTKVLVTGFFGEGKETDLSSISWLLKPYFFHFFHLRTVFHGGLYCIDIYWLHVFCATLSVHNAILVINISLMCLQLSDIKFVHKRSHFWFTLVDKGYPQRALLCIRRNCSNKNVFFFYVLSQVSNSLFSFSLHLLLSWWFFVCFRFID